MVFRYLVPALAVAGRAAAQCSGSTTIQNTGDATGLANCLTYSGDITIATNAPDIRLDGIRRIDGSLTLKNNDALSSFGGDQLQQIDDTFVISNIQLLTTLNFPSLTSVTTVEWDGLPNLQGLSMDSGLSQAETLNIQNTGLYSLEGINLNSVDTVIIANNGDLTEISMQVDHISGSLSLQANGQDLAVSFPNLEIANNATFRNCSSINLDSLAAVNGSLGFLSNFMDSISTPNLTSVGGTLGFISNAQLNNISMPRLKMLTGGLLIANNTNLEEVDGFPALTSVMGNVDCTGNLESVELPSINLVRGAFNIQSTKNIEPTCNKFENIAGPNEEIRGKFKCKSRADNPQTVGGSNTLSGGGSSTSSGAAVPLHISGATGVLGVVAAIFGML